MKKLVEVVDAPDGFVSAMGKEIYIISMRYSYTGKLIGVNEKFIMLDNMKIVFDTGEYKNPPKFANAETPYNKEAYIAVGAIEFWTVLPS